MACREARKRAGSYRGTTLLEGANRGKRRARANVAAMSYKRVGMSLTIIARSPPYSEAAPGSQSPGQHPPLEVAMKRGMVIAGIEVLTDEGLRQVPPGVCWIIEGALWVKLVWHGDGDRQAATLSLREYQSCVQRGDIRFEQAPSFSESLRRPLSLATYRPA
jgi:hypothetical protein